MVCMRFRRAADVPASLSPAGCSVRSPRPRLACDRLLEATAPRLAAGSRARRLRNEFEAAVDRVLGKARNDERPDADDPVAGDVQAARPGLDGSDPRPERLDDMD